MPEQQIDITISASPSVVTFNIPN